MPRFSAFRLSKNRHWNHGLRSLNPRIEAFMHNSWPRLRPHPSPPPSSLLRHAASFESETFGIPFPTGNLSRLRHLRRRENSAFYTSILPAPSSFSSLSQQEPRPRSTTDLFFSTVSSFFFLSLSLLFFIIHFVSFIYFVRMLAPIHTHIYICVRCASMYMMFVLYACSLSVLIVLSFLFLYTYVACVCMHVCVRVPFFFPFLTYDTYTRLPYTCIIVYMCVSLLVSLCPY